MDSLITIAVVLDFVLIGMVIAFWVAVYRALRAIVGIEHAAWAVVTQLKAMRPPELPDVVQQALHERAGEQVRTEVRGGVQRIANSMFGR